MNEKLKQKSAENVGVEKMNLDDDIAMKELIDLKTVAKILGLKYHTARNICISTHDIGCVDYGRKKLWIKDDVLTFKRRCYTA